MAYTFRHLSVPELILITGDVHKDNRGSFFELYKKSEFFKNGIIEDFVQDNFSISQKNVLRGLHFQIEPQAQGKLVRALEGKIWDVAVDLRPASATFKKWAAEELSGDSSKALYIPAGFAHGFVALSETAFVLYKTTREYNSQLEQGIIWNDPELNIVWPAASPILSAKDAALPKLSEVKFFD